jgi:hypothetical protein
MKHKRMKQHAYLMAMRNKPINMLLLADGRSPD